MVVLQVRVSTHGWQTAKVTRQCLVSVSQGLRVLVAQAMSPHFEGNRDHTSTLGPHIVRLQFNLTSSECQQLVSVLDCFTFMYMCGGEIYSCSPKEADLGQLDKTIVFYGKILLSEVYIYYYCTAVYSYTSVCITQHNQGSVPSRV